MLDHIGYWPRQRRMSKGCCGGGGTRDGAVRTPDLGGKSSTEGSRGVRRAARIRRVPRSGSRWSCLWVDLPAGNAPRIGGRLVLSFRHLHLIRCGGLRPRTNTPGFLAIARSPCAGNARKQSNRLVERNGRAPSTAGESVSLPSDTSTSPRRVAEQVASGIPCRTDMNRRPHRV